MTRGVSHSVSLATAVALIVLGSPGYQARSPEASGLSAAPAAVGPPAVTRAVVVPAGTVLRLRLDRSIGSDISRVEQPVQAHLERAIIVNGTTAVPAGSRVFGTVTDVKRSGRVKGRAHIAIRFHTLQVGEGRYPMRTQAVGRTAPSTKKEDVAKIAIPATGGAIVGGIVGGKKGAEVGGALGGGGGTAYVLSTRGKEIRLGRGAVLAVRLTEPLQVHV